MKYTDKELEKYLFTEEEIKKQMEVMENNLEKTKFYAYDDTGNLKRVNKCMTELTETEEINIYEKDKNVNNRKERKK